MYNINGDLFRKEIKAAGLKGVTVRNRHYNFYVFTVKLSDDDYLPIDQINHRPAGAWFDQVHYFELSGPEQAAALATEKKEYFDFVRLEGCDLSYGYGKEILSNAGKRKIEKIESILIKYHVSDSDSMHDIFNDNFYYAIVNR